MSVLCDMDTTMLILMQRKWVEFRFANIYNSLNFKRELLEDHDWEHCMTEYASDPCDVAQGVHMD